MNHILNELKAAALLTAMENQRDGIEEVFSGKRKSLKLDLSDTKDMTFAGNFPTANASIANVRPGVVPLYNRTSHVRELVPQGLMNGSNYIFVRESVVPAKGNLPGPPNERGEKNEVEINYQEYRDAAITKSQWIAGIMVLSRNMMDDIVAFASYLESRLPELLLNAEDDQLINGNGSGNNISGILDSGNFVASTSSGALSVNTILQDLGQLAAFGRNVNGILLNDQTYFNLFTSSTNAAISTTNGQMFIAGVPVFRNLSLATGQSIVGDWTNGANLITREPVRVEFFYEDSDNVRQNKVTVRVEERIAFPIFGGSYFVHKT